MSLLSRITSADQVQNSVVGDVGVDGSSSHNSQLQTSQNNCKNASAATQTVPPFQTYLCTPVSGLLSHAGRM